MTILFHLKRSVGCEGRTGRSHPWRDINRRTRRFLRSQSLRTGVGREWKANRQKQSRLVVLPPVWKDERLGRALSHWFGGGRRNV